MQNIDNYIKAPLPHFEGTKPAHVFGGWNLMISKYSKNKNEAIKFIKFLISEETQLYLNKNAYSLPIVKSLYDKHDHLTFYKNLFKNGTYRPIRKDYTRISDIASYFVNKAIKGEMSVDDALVEIDDYIKSNKMIYH